MIDVECKHWKKVPDSFGDKPICGFYANGKFNKHNWACKLLFDLRELLGEKESKGIWNDDQNIYVGKLGDEFWWQGNKFSHVIVGVYKGRGNTEGVWLVDGNEMIPVTEKKVLKIVEILRGKNEAK